MPDQYGRDMRDVRQISVPQQGLPSFSYSKPATPAANSRQHVSTIPAIVEGKIEKPFNSPSHLSPHDSLNPGPITSKQRSELEYEKRSTKREERTAAEREARYQKSLRYTAKQEILEKDWREDKRLRADSARFQQEQDREVELDEDNLP